MNFSRFLVAPDTKVSLKDHSPSYTGDFKSKESGERELNRELKKLRPLQDMMYAQKRYGVLVILQGMDASGKDGVVSHIFSGANPNWCAVTNFKTPSAEEIEHDYLWRCYKNLPRRGTIGIFNRSYYEEATIIRIKPDLLKKQNLPPEARGPDIWDNRFESINAMEKHLARNGFPVLKFFLHLSKSEQKRRLLQRIKQREKNWKFSLDDVFKRQDWKLYIKAYESIFRHTSTKYAPWHIIPADNKWFARAIIANIIIEKLKELNLEYPVAGHEDRHNFLEGKLLLQNE